MTDTPQDDGLVERVARAIYEAQHFAGPVGDEPIEWGRGGYKTQVIVWAAAARAAIAAMPIAALRAENEALRADYERLQADFSTNAEMWACCESCGAPLGDGDDYIEDDCSGCWAGMTDDPRARDHPCYAYRVGKPDARTRIVHYVR